MKRARFQKIVDEHKNWVYSHALYVLGNPDDAADVTQEVLIRAWQNLDSIRRPSTKAWLLRVTHNLCIDYARKSEMRNLEMHDEDVNVLETRIASSQTGSNPERAAMRADLRRQVVAALQRLPEHHRSVLIMREIHGLKYEEISRALGIPLNSVKVYIHRGREELRKILRRTLEVETR